MSENKGVDYTNNIQEEHKKNRRILKIVIIGSMLFFVCYLSYRFTQSTVTDPRNTAVNAASKALLETSNQVSQAMSTTYTTLGEQNKFVQRLNETAGNLLTATSEYYDALKKVSSTVSLLEDISDCKNKYIAIVNLYQSKYAMVFTQIKDADLKRAFLDAMNGGLKQSTISFRKLDMLIKPDDIFKMNDAERIVQVKEIKDELDKHYSRINALVIMMTAKIAEDEY